MYNYSLKDINTSFSCYNQFTDLYNKIKDFEFSSINIDLQKWFGANMSAVLGGILDKISNKNTITISSTNINIINILKRNFFLANYGYGIEPDRNGTTIKYLKLKPSESRYFNSYIMNDLLSQPNLPQMSSKLKKKIAESIYEIFVNAQTHSCSDFIYTCGQFFPHKSKIEFTIVDMGLGFKKTINKNFDTSLSSIQAIKWALKDGNTTKKDIPGGLGLSVLTEFIKLNKGKFQIISDDGFYELGTSERTEFLDNPFPGTIVNMEFLTNDFHSYDIESKSYNLDEIF